MYIYTRSVIDGTIEKRAFLREKVSRKKGTYFYMQNTIRIYKLSYSGKIILQIRKLINIS